ncbi:MAG: dipeptide/oligopeptide/nickel ABC transporter ATP-binding protein, partial [Clostridiales bacterium]|nr:dipeptide/oligopeptide/nickel ABC transporter ATP-binding protein [Clostridiales bacterium]
MNILTSENLHKKFPMRGGNSVCAVNGVNLEIEAGATLGLVGESGCGKSTIGRMIMRLAEPSDGNIFYQGIDLFQQKASENVRLRRDIQIVFQDPYSSLNPRKHVKYIIEEPMVLTGIGTKRERHDKVVEMLKLVELDETYLNKYPIELTQGEQQRIGVARAFVTDPKIIVLDEPTSLLDIRFRGEIVLLLKKLQKQLGCSYLFIS